MRTKEYSQLGACGIVCSLCPRFYTNGPSRCPGCGHERFREAHPSCKIHTCACVKQTLETCADCKEFPCAKIAPWDSGDSFVTHQTCLGNLRRVQSDGYAPLLEEIRRRTQVLETLLERFDDGRSKSFDCLACALLSASELEHLLQDAAANSMDSVSIRQRMQAIAREQGVDLRLRTERTQS